MNTRKWSKVMVVMSVALLLSLGIVYAEETLAPCESLGSLDAVGIKGNNFLSVIDGQYSSGKNKIGGELMYKDGLLQQTNENYGILIGVNRGEDPRPVLKEIKDPQWVARVKPEVGTTFVLETKNNLFISVFTVTKVTAEKVEFIYSVFEE